MISSSGRTRLVAAVTVIAGFALSSVSWWCFLLVALGAFGPGVLREIGWLRDKDEYQRRAEQRAGYHAYLVGGVATCVLVAFLRSGAREIGDPRELATVLLALLALTWIFSSLCAYWGARSAAARLLQGFGGAWLLFAIVSNVGAEWSGWAALVLHALLAAPFFALAWLGRRWPRPAGALLLLVSAGFAALLTGRDNLDLITRGVTLLLFVGPLLGGGFALLGAGDERAEDDDA